MRVTDRATFERGREAIQAAQQRQAAAADTAATGVAVKKPWDSPEAGSVVRHRFDAARHRAIATSAERAAAELSVADSALGDIVQLFTDANAAAVQMANDSYNANDRKAAAIAIRRATQALTTSLNADAGGRYVFAGSLDGAPPFDSSGTYAGDATVRQIELGQGVVVPVAISGSSISGAPVDLFATLDALATALESDDVPGIRASIDATRAAVEHVGGIETDVGGIQLGLAFVQHGATQASDAADARRAALADADFVGAATDLALASRALDAAMAATTKTFAPTLLDRLR